MKTRSIPIIVMGLTSILMQITVLRQLISVFSGNELDIGITLSVWLTAVGIGSYAGYKLRIKNAFAMSFVLVAFLSQLTVLSIDLIRPVFSFEIGETIPLITIITATIISISFLCLIAGSQFPLAVSYLKRDPSKVYALEAAGAFTGGVLFTLFLSGRLDAYILSAMIGTMNILIALFLLRKKFLIGLLLVPVILYFGTDRIKTTFHWKGIEFIEKTESRYGEITVLKIREQLNVYSSGKFQFSYPDIQTEELKAHLPMSLQPAPSRILVIGGSPAVLRELLRYPVSEIDFVEIDPEMINLSLKILGNEDSRRLSDRRLKMIVIDARRFIKTLNAKTYDLIVLNLAEPSTANINRFYTVEFFNETRAVLKEGGVLFLSLPTSYGYIGKRMQMANGSIYNSLKNVFSHVAVSSEEYGIIIGSDSLINIDPEVLGSRFSKRALDTKYFHPYILKDAFSPLKADMVKKRLGQIDALNKDMRPVAYLYNLMLWLEIHKSSTLMSVLEYRKEVIASLIILLVISAAILFRKKKSVYYSIFTTGYSTMTFSMIIILAYQATFGYVYEMIGIISATFMLGIAAGAYIGRGAKQPLRWLKSFEFLTIMFLMSSPLFFTQEFLFYVLSILAGIIAGVEFAVANKFMKRQDIVMIAGKLYAFDLAGSFLGAFLTTIFLVPLYGIQNTIFFVVLIKVVSLSLLFSIRQRTYDI